MVENERNGFGWRSWSEAIQLARKRTEWKNFIDALCDILRLQDRWWCSKDEDENFQVICAKQNWIHQPVFNSTNNRLFCCAGAQKIRKFSKLQTKESWFELSRDSRAHRWSMRSDSSGRFTSLMAAQEFLVNFKVNCWVSFNFRSFVKHFDFRLRVWFALNLRKWKLVNSDLPRV